VAVLAYDQAPTFELSIPAEVFADAALGGRYELRTIAAGGRRPRTSAGWAIATDGGMDLLKSADTLVVAGWRDDLADPPRSLCEAIVSAQRRGTRLVSLCTGAFLLAAAGVLDGRRATTHWRHAASFAERYPDVQLDPAVLYVDEGDVLTSAGSVAGIDLCLHIVRCDWGAQLANAVARRLVYAPHRPGGQAQYVQAPALSDASDDDGLLAWIREHLDEPLSLEQLAARSHVSVRQLSRRFKARTGASPHRWILQQRVAHAQALLETTRIPVEEVARETGFGSSAALRLHFTRDVGTAPQYYRRSFQSRRDS
jgi:AraC family transcriptional activator FtrA